MNITLSADEQVIERARAVAQRQGKSLNELVREYLVHLGARADAQSAVEELFGLMDEGGGRLEGRRWTREQAHER